MGIQQLGSFGMAPSSRTYFAANNSGQQQTVSNTGGPLAFALKSTQAVHVPGGNWIVQAGQYSNIMTWDQQSMMWRFLTPFDQVPYMLSSDGSNYQVVNTTGGVIGAVVTNAGTANTELNGFYGYNQSLQFVQYQNGVLTTGLSTSTAPVSATTTGGALLNVFVGGAINTSVTITSGGSGFTEAPNLIVVPPANQGAQPFIPATMTCTISGGAINAVTVTNQGAGYVSAPTVLVVPQESDTTGTYSTAVLTTSLSTYTGKVTAVTMASPGTAQFTSVPTITFGGTVGIASAAATALCNFSITALAINAVGAVYGTSKPTYTIAQHASALPTPVLTNPAIELNLMPAQYQPVVHALSATGDMTGVTPTILHGGYGFLNVPLASPYPLTTIATTQATWTVTAGGNTDTVYLYPI